MLRPADHDDEGGVRARRAAPYRRGRVRHRAAAIREAWRRRSGWCEGVVVVFRRCSASATPERDVSVVVLRLGACCLALLGSKPLRIVKSTAASVMWLVRLSSRALPAEWVCVRIGRAREVEWRSPDPDR